MPHMALVSTSGTDSLVTDSANSASAYTTGHKSCVNAMGVYCARNKSNLDHPKVETISELVKRTRGMSVGVVTNTEIEDATPAAMVAHNRLRADYNNIVKDFFAVQPEVILGGGTPNFLAEVDARLEAHRRGRLHREVQRCRLLLRHDQHRARRAAKGANKLLGLFNTGNIDGALDRFFLKKGNVAKFPDQPDLTDQVRAALDVLSKNDKGFVLMVESGRIDKYSHSLDWERAVYDTIMLDNAVKVAKDFAADRNDTLIIVVPDHAHGVAIVGTYDDEKSGEPLRAARRLQPLAVPELPGAERRRLSRQGRRLAPPRLRVQRLSGLLRQRPALSRRRERAGGRGRRRKATYVANEKNCAVPGAVRRTGNLPFNMNSGVHAADDVILTAMGPGAEQFRGRIDNTRVFRAMATALGLAPGPSN